ncbi:MAG: WG repeat-containing protein [Propionicimonas sp.]
MRKHRACAMGLAIAGLIAGLAACTPQAPPPTASAPSATPAGTPTTPSPEPSPAEPSGPSAMPASDGGPMLWPTRSVRTVDLESWTTEQIRYGFVDARGALAVPPRYDGYEYCRDETGRATLVLAGTGVTEVDILDLSGEVIGHVPGRFARCVGDSHAEFQTDSSEIGPLEYGSGLFDLRSGEVVIKAKAGRTVAMVDRRTVNVHRAKDEYFLDLVTGEKTPHPGFLTGYLDPSSSPADLALIPASTVLIDTYSGSEEDLPPIGYLDRSGDWALEPAFSRADPFRAGYAVVGDDASLHFVDTAFQQVGGDWNWANPTEWGYEVGAEGDDQSDPGLLGLDLRVILEPGVAETTCSGSSPSVCDVYPHSGQPQTLLLPEGTLVDPPDGFGHALSRTQFSDEPRESPATRVHDVSTGTTFALDRPSYCWTVGTWISCSPAAKTAPSAVHRPDGERTEFRDVTSVEGPVQGTASGYYWATAGSHQGFIDDTGRWLYRESRYTTLED